MANPDLTQYLVQAGKGDREALHRIYPLVYRELSSIAKNIRFHFHGVATMNTTAIIHEAYLKFADKDTNYESRKHFYSIAAKAMRQVLLNAARNKNADKRGSGSIDEAIEDVQEKISLSQGASDMLIDLDALLTELEAQDPLYGKIVECRFFSSLSIKETAEVLDVSPATVKRKWQFSRDFLYTHLSVGI